MAPPSPSPLEQALVFLIAESSEMMPDDLGPSVVQAGTLLGGTDVKILLVDLEQPELRSIAGDGAFELVEGTVAGEAFRSGAFVHEDVEGGVRIWIPILDSAERVGVLGAIVA